MTNCFGKLMKFRIKSICSWGNYLLRMNIPFFFFKEQIPVIFVFFNFQLYEQVGALYIFGTKGLISGPNLTTLQAASENLQCP